MEGVTKDFGQMGPKSFQKLVGFHFSCSRFSGRCKRGITKFFHFEDVFSRLNLVHDENLDKRHLFPVIDIKNQTVIARYRKRDTFSGQ